MRAVLEEQVDYKLEAEKALAFFDAVRTAMDGAEIGVLMGWEKERPKVILVRATCQIEVAARNLQFAIEQMHRILFLYEQERKNAAPIDGVSTGGTVVPTKEVGSDSLSKSAASPAKREA